MPIDQYRTGNEPLTGLVLCSITVPAALWFWAELADAINSMGDPENWEQIGTVTIDQATQSAIAMARSFQTMIGTIIPYVTADPPNNTLACDGTEYLRVDYPELYAVIDAAFKTDADHFVTPDLRGATIVGTSSGYAMGASGGEATHTLTTAELAAHSHSDSGHQHTTGNSLSSLAVMPGEGPVLVPNPIPALTGSASANIQNAGGGEAHNNLPPYVALGYALVAQ